MTNKILDIVLLAALPASGKSEVRKYLKSITAEKRSKEFHMGPTIQLDDFPYIHMMQRIDQELAAINQPRIFFPSDEKPLITDRDLGAAIKLINEDYNDIVTKKKLNPSSAAQYLFSRIDEAGAQVGISPRLSTLNKTVRDSIADKLENECLELLNYKLKLQAEDLDGKTFIIEFARGGPIGSTMPLTGDVGYQYSLPLLSEEILEKASLLYIWVTPEESRRKNVKRADPNNPGSILHHGVAEAIMLHNYGCDDTDWLEANSEKPGTLTVNAHGENFYIPIARFDNRMDKTDFLRKDQKLWEPDQINGVHEELKKAYNKLAAFRNF